MAVRIQVRRGTAAQWTAANPVLAAGEPGFETDTGWQKIGNGSDAWADLEYEVTRERVETVESSQAQITASVATLAAVGDGTTDDTAALEAALATGKHVQLAKGKTYLYRRPLYMMTPGQIFDGRGATLKRAAQAVTTTTTAITAGVTTSITVAALSGGSGSGAWTLQVGDQIVIEQGGVIPPHSRKITGIVGNVVTVDQPFEITVSGTTNVRHGWNQLQSAAADQQVSNVVLDGNSANWSWGRWQHTTAIYSDALSPRLRVHHCRIVNQYGDGAVAAAPGTRWVLNSFENIKGRGFVFGGASGSPTNFDTQVLFNRFINCNGDIAVGGSDGVGSITFSQGGPGTLIHGNYIDGGVDGIGAVRSINNGDVTITANELWNITGIGIGRGGSGSETANNVTVADNRLYGCGIELTNTSQPGVITRWNIHDNLIVGGKLVLTNCDKLRFHDNTIDCDAIGAPRSVVAAAVAGGGAFAAGTYYWVVTALNAAGETVGSPEVSAVVATNGRATITWAQVPGASSYKLYRAASSGGQNAASSLVATITGATTTTYTDTGAATSTGAVPATDTTAIINTTLVSLGAASGPVTNTSIRGNHLYGGQYGVVFHTGCSNIDVENNKLLGQYSIGIWETVTGLPHITVARNSVAARAGRSGTWTGINTGGSGRYVGNTVDFTLGGTAGVLVVSGAARAIFEQNWIKGGAFSSVFVVQVSGAADTIIRNNILDFPIINSGTRTVMRDNQISTGLPAGVATLVGGTVTISTVEVRTGDRIILSRVTGGGTRGMLEAVIASASSLTINSVDSTGALVADTSTVAWRIDH